MIDRTPLLALITKMTAPLVIRVRNQLLGVKPDRNLLLKLFALCLMPQNVCVNVHALTAAQTRTGGGLLTRRRRPESPPRVCDDHKQFLYEKDTRRTTEAVPE